MVPEGPQPGPSRRGRKDPDLAQRLMLDEDTELLADAGEDQSQEVTLLDAGDLVMARFSQEHKFSTDGHEAWFGLGTVTHVREGEDIEEALFRAATFVHDGVGLMIDRAEDAAHAAAEARRTRPISHRQ